MRSVLAERAKPKILCAGIAVQDIVIDMGGSISAEHGIGVMKRADLARVKSEVEMDLMRRIKAALDPKSILNPGKVL